MKPYFREKFPETAFKALSYLVLWLCAIYVTFFTGHDFFNKTLSLWDSARYKWTTQPTDLRLMYGLQASFYFYSVYSTLYMDKWKRDSHVMLLHHVVTLTLICFAYSVGYLKIGVIIFVCNDICDVLLETAKAMAYLQKPGDRYEHFWINLGNVLSSLFAVSWLVLRNLFHLTKVFRSSSFGTFYSMPYLPNPMYLFFNILVGSLYLFYMYWSYYIVMYIIRLWSGTMQDGQNDDPRDEEVHIKYKRINSDEDKKENSKKEDDEEQKFKLDDSPNNKGRKED